MDFEADQPQSILGGVAMMTSRERVTTTLNHQQPDRVPVDLGSTSATGISASSLYRLRGALGLEQRPVRVHEPYQMLGEVDDDALDALGVDVVGLGDDSTLFGFPTRDWKPFTLFDGTPVLVPGGFNTEIAEDGYLYQYPCTVTRFAVSPFRTAMSHIFKDFQSHLYDVVGFFHLDMGHETTYKSITGGIFEFGFSDAILQMWAAFVYEREHRRLPKEFAGCIRPEEVAFTHKLFTAALESNKNCSTVALNS